MLHAIIPGRAWQVSSLGVLFVGIYGLHRHFTGGSSIVMFGGGTKKGFLYGKTADERPCLAIENPVSIEDLHATIFTAMGISPRTEFSIEGRPFYATRDGHGRAVQDVFA